MLGDKILDHFHADEMCRQRLSRDRRFDRGLEEHYQFIEVVGRSTLSYDEERDVLFYKFHDDNMIFVMYPQTSVFDVTYFRVFNQEQPSYDTTDV